MGFDVDLIGASELRKSLVGAEPRIQEALRNEAIRRVRAMAFSAKNRAAHLGRLQRHAGRTVGSRATRDGAEMKGGGSDSTLGGAVFMGSEFGGRRKLKTYMTRSRSGNPYVVRRHTTRMFRVHLGTVGYFFWPSVRRGLRGLSDTASRLIEENVVR